MFLRKPFLLYFNVGLWHHPLFLIDVHQVKGKLSQRWFAHNLEALEILIVGHICTIEKTMLVEYNENNLFQLFNN
jgi:hypothetical protein